MFTQWHISILFCLSHIIELLLRISVAPMCFFDLLFFFPHLYTSSLSCPLPFFNMSSPSQLPPPCNLSNIINVQPLLKLCTGSSFFQYYIEHPSNFLLSLQEDPGAAAVCGVAMAVAVVPSDEEYNSALQSGERRRHDCLLSHTADPIRHV